MTPITRNILAGNILCVFLIGGVGLWGGMSTVAGAVIAPGILVVDTSPKKVQHPNGGIVRQIFVRDGDHVKAGDLLLRLDQTISQANMAVLEQDIRGDQQQIASKNQELSFIEQELSAVRKLYNKGLSTIVRLTALERDQTKTQGERQQLLSDIASNNAKLIAARDQLARIDIRAPQSGVIDQSDVHTLGGVVNPGETLMLIIPEESLVVESKIAPKDIPQVKFNQTAFLRFTSFNYKTTPEIEGVVSRISADVTTDPKTAATYYTIRLSLPPAQVKRLGPVHLVPGMPVEAFIKTGDRKVISYLTKPLTDQMYRAFREE